jgi:hypothetical protein
MMESWVLQWIRSIFKFIDKITIDRNPTLQYPKTHFSNIPSFHHSNWGEGPILDRNLGGTKWN